MNFYRRLFYFLAYWRQPPWETGITPPEVYQFINSHSPGRALDLGCGTGTNAITLAQAGWQVVGVDFIPQAIRRARLKARKAGVKVQFHLQDVTRLEGVAGPFDLVLDIGCFHSLSSQGKAAVTQRIFDLLQPGGFFLMYGFYPADPGASSGITQAEFIQLGQKLQLVEKVEGLERGRLPSAWFTFQKSPEAGA